MPRPDAQNRTGYGTLEDLSSDMERVFDSLLGRTVGTMLRTSRPEKYVPSLDVAENAESFEVHVDLPGVKPEDVKIEMHEGALSISGTRSSVQESENENYHRIERNSGSFHRVISVPNDVDVDKIDASYESGVLTVRLPKVEKKQPKKIQIRTS